jgi:hypothetical protein
MYSMATAVHALNRNFTCFFFAVLIRPLHILLTVLEVYYQDSATLKFVISTVYVDLHMLQYLAKI